MEKLLLIAFLFYVLQMILTYFQVKDFRSNVDELRKKGVIGIGSKKRKLSAGTIVILVSNEVGDIIEGRMMKGFSILARFKNFKEVNGCSISQLKEKIHREDSKNTAMLDALNQIESQLLKLQAM
ncbi:transcriptional regulator GutM [Pelosinus propionicus]|uniref:Glucitol operon activator protein (GutM) n=1 Tax=Pelosinus propionicus DSM 13327 TaxID=1123291 RepID=A0A1I4I0C0_9FIRM|nr:transcriptional regulator GutM [Pelosinus propionicus]SFL47882.1 Glucitol operon activator protein (GutM) [Pelosinus propionicus DSM 13327]